MIHMRRASQPRWLRFVARGLAAVGLVPGVLAGLTACQTVDEGVFFDDFNYGDARAMTGGGWTLRDKPGNPGVPAATWSPQGVLLLDDPAQVGNRLLRLIAETGGTPETTRQTQVCHARKYLEGTYAARVRLTDSPVSGPDGDVVVQTFYVVSPLRHDFDPTYSELDWEYLPNGGWGNPKPRLYSTSWQTVQLEPWNAFNQFHQQFGEIQGWHVLLMQVAYGRVRYFLDGFQLAEHGGRNYPVVPMSLNLNHWFAVGGLVNAKATRIYYEDVDWVFHARNRVLSPPQVLTAVKRFRRAGTGHADSVPAADPPLPCPCDF